MEQRSRLGSKVLAQLVLALAGAVLGTLCDRIHVHFGVLWYPHPASWLGGQAAWVPPLFGGAALALTGGYALIARWYGGDTELAPRRAVVLPLGAFVAAYLATGLLARWPTALTGLLVVAWLGRVVIHPHRPTVVFALVIAVAGPLFEAGLSSTGAFSYRRPAWLVPEWLPALYLHLAPLVRHIHAAFLQPPPPRATREQAAYLSLRSFERDGE